MPLPSLHQLSLSTGSVLRTSEVSKRIGVSFVDILKTRIDRFEALVSKSGEVEADLASLDAERVLLRDVLIEFTIQRAFDCVCLHPPVAVYLDDPSVEELRSFLKRAQDGINGTLTFSSETLEALKADLDAEVDLSVQILNRLENVWLDLHTTQPKSPLSSWVSVFKRAMDPQWSECRLSPNVKMFDGPREHTKALKIWWASEVGKREWDPEEEYVEEQEGEEEEGEEEAEEMEDSDSKENDLCPGVYAHGLYSGSVKVGKPLSFEHVIPKSWCNTTESILELEQCVEDASLIALVTKTNNTSRSNNILPLLMREKYRRSLSIPGLWKPLPMRGFTLARRAMAARITARGFLAYPFLQPPTLSHEGMEESIVELTHSPHFSTHVLNPERTLCAIWEIGLSLLFWREIGAPFNVLTLFAHTNNRGSTVDTWRPRFDALLRLRLQERDAFRALLLAHSPTLRLRLSLDTSARDYANGAAIASPPAESDGGAGSSTVSNRSKRFEADNPTPTPNEYMTLKEIEDAGDKTLVLYLDNKQGDWKEGTIVEKGKKVKLENGTLTLVEKFAVGDGSGTYRIVLKPSL